VVQTVLVVKHDGLNSMSMEECVEHFRPSRCSQAHVT
jgi:hypothetical protein